MDELQGHNEERKLLSKKRRGRGRREKAENRVILSRKARLKLLTGEEATKGSGMRMLRILGFESDF